HARQARIRGRRDDRRGAATEFAGEHGLAVQGAGDCTSVTGAVGRFRAGCRAMTSLSDNTVIRVPALAALPRVRHGFFTRNASLDEIHGEANCAYRNAEETSTVDAARERCTAALQSNTLVTAKQRHTPDVVTVEKPWSWHDAPVADALVT